MNKSKYATYLFDKIKNLTFSSPGVTRQTYGTGENLTHKFLIKELREFADNITIDYGGNFIATIHGINKKKNIIKAKKK